MGLPLYREVREQAPVHDPRKPAGHAGLWFQRFYDRYKADFSNAKVNDNAFREWLAGFHHLAGDADLLDTAILRQSLLVSQLGGEMAVFRCPWHFVSGMGNEHPIENGFNWHPVWGAPYLPGSGLKGLVRAWVEAWRFNAEDAEETRLKQQRLLDWFGSVSKTPEDESDAQTGKVIFFDAIPLRPVRLATDIMTPHMGEWYAQGEKIQDVQRDADKLPADWHSPNPIYFLSAKEPVFLVSVAPRNELVSAEIDLDEVMQCVADALDWLGAGAKTAVGYGQFLRDDAETAKHHEAMKKRITELQQQREQADALKGLSGVALELMQHSQKTHWAQNKDAFVRPGEVDVWMEKLAGEPHLKAVRHLRELFEAHYPGLLDDPDKMNVKKKKPEHLFKDRPRALAKQFLAIETAQT